MGEGPGAPTDRAAAIRAGQAAARARGVRFGRPPKYDQVAAEELRAAAADGTSLRGLAALYGMSVGTVRRLLVTEGQGVR